MKKLLAVALGVCCASCAHTPEPAPIEPAPDASMLEDHLVAAQARRAESLGAIETARLRGLDWDAQAKKFRRVTWVGDAADLCRAINAKTGLSCKVTGKRAWVLPVSLAGRDLSIDDLLRDAGAQIGARADFIHTAEGVTLEYKLPG